MKINIYYPTAVAVNEPLDNRFFYTDKSYLTIKTEKGTYQYKLNTKLLRLLSVIITFISKI